MEATKVKQIEDINKHSCYNFIRKFVGCRIAQTQQNKKLKATSQKS